MTGLTLIRSHYRFFRKQWARISGLLCLDSLSAILEMVPPLFSIVIFDYALPRHNFSWLLLAVGGAFAVYLLYLILSSWGDHYNTKLDQEMTADLATELFYKVENAPLRISQKLRSGDLMVRLVDDADVVTGLLLNLPSHLVIAVIQLILFFIVAVILDPWVALLGLLALPAYMWETHVYSKRLEKTQEELQENDSQLYDGLQEKLANIRTIKAFNRNDYERGRLLDLFFRRARTTIKHKVLSLYQTLTHSLTMQLWTAAITLYLGFEVIRGVLTVGEMITLGIYLPLIQAPIRDLAQLWSQTRIGMVSLRRVSELEDLPQEKEIRGQATAPVTEAQEAHLRLQNISFSYGDNQEVLQQLNIKIPDKSLTAIVGPSGIGKSTLAHLLLRMFHPDDGAILYQGRNLQEMNLSELRNKIGIVFQEISLFSGTVRENISYGKPDASQEEIVEAAEKANAHQFISNLPQGYETPLMGHGRNLSAGQRQRLGLARSLLLKPEVLILDEVTSALDAEAEFLIEETLERLRRTMTILLITHQLSSAKKADRILFMDEGRIVEEGTFKELINKKGRFYDLYNIQSGGFQEFKRRLDVELERHQRYREAVSLLMIEPHDYQLWKEQETPQALSLVMENIAQKIRHRLRVMDFCSVYTENKIVIALPQTDAAGAELMVGRLLPILEKIPFQLKDKTLQTTFFFGLGSCNPHEWAYSEQLFLQAEEDLEKKKNV